MLELWRTGYVAITRTGLLRVQDLPGQYGWFEVWLIFVEFLSRLSIRQ